MLAITTSAFPANEKTYVVEVDGRRTVVPASCMSPTMRIGMRELERELREAWAEADASGRAVVTEG